VSAPYRTAGKPYQENRKDQIASAIMWLDLAGRITNLSPKRLVKRLQDGDDALADAVLALLEISGRPAERLANVRDFLVTQELGEEYESSANVVYREPSPFEVPTWALDEWFPPQDDKPKGNGPRVHSESTRRLLRVKQFYDCLAVGGDGMGGGSWAGIPFRVGSRRLFGNANIGDTLRTNLQVPGQFVFDATLLVTSWWISTLESWPQAEAFFAKSWVSLTVGDRQEAVQPGLTLWRGRQPLLVPIPVRYNVFVTFDAHELLELHQEGPPIPVYVFVEGWTVKQVR